MAADRKLSISVLIVTILVTLVGFGTQAKPVTDVTDTITNKTGQIDNGTVTEGTEDGIWELCTQEFVYKHCDYWPSKKTLRCDQSLGLDPVRCVVSPNREVRTLVLEGFDSTTASLEAFMSIAKLNTLKLRNWQNPVDLSAVIEMFPFITRLDCSGTSVLPLKPVRRGALLEDIMGLRVDSALGDVRKLNLHYLKTLSVTITKDAEANLTHEQVHSLFSGLTLQELRYRNEFTLNFDWSHVACNSTSLVRLYVVTPASTVFPMGCPFQNLQRVVIHSNNVQFNPLMLCGVDEMPLLKLHTVILHNFKIDVDINVDRIPALWDFVLFNPIGRPGHLRTQRQGIAGQDYSISPLIKGIRELKIHYGSFQVLTKDSFQSVPLVTQITIRQCGVETVDRNTFVNLTQLERLSLENNNLATFFTDLSLLKSLYFVNLAGNQLTSFPLQLIQLPAINIIFLENNKITHLEQNFIPEFNMIGQNLTLVNMTENTLICSCGLTLLRDLLPSTTQLLGTCQGDEVQELNQLSLFKNDSRCAPVTNLRTARTLKLKARPADLHYTLADSGTFVPKNRKLVQTKLKSIDKFETSLESNSFVRPDLGIGFDKFAYLYPNLEDYYVHIQIKWPKLHLPKFNFVPDGLANICADPEPLIMHICQDYQPLIAHAQSKATLYAQRTKLQLQELHSLFAPISKSGSNNNKRKHKRQAETTTTSPVSTSTAYSLEFLLNQTYQEPIGMASEIVSLFVPKVGSSIHIEVSERRAKAFRLAIMILAGRTDLLEESHLDLRSDVTKAFNLISETFDNSTVNLELLFSLINDTNEDLLKVSQSVSNSLNILQQKVQAIRFLSLLTARFLQLWNNYADQYHELSSQLTQLLLSVNALQRGEILPTLLSPTVLQNAVDTCVSSLSKWRNDYEFVFTSLAQYYTYSRPALMVLKDGIILQLLIPMTAKGSHRYSLYHAQALTVPVNAGPAFMRNTANHDYTHINLPAPYLAVSDSPAHRHFIQISMETLEKCLRADQTYFCSEAMLEIDQQHDTCLTSLYTNASVATIVEKCDIDYIFEPYRPLPKILDLGHSVIISGLLAPWRHQCKASRLPSDVQGAPYAILSRSALCQCTLTGANGHVARRMTDCEVNNPPILNLKYVMNTLAAFSYDNITNMDKLPNITHEILDTPPIEIPQLQTIHRLKEVQLRNTTMGSIKLRRLAKLIRQKGDRFRSEYDKIISDIQLRAYFTPEYWYKGLSFVGAMAGILALCLAIYLCACGRYAEGMMKTFMFMGTTPAAVSAISPSLQPGMSCPTHVGLTNEALFYVTISHVLTVLLVLLFIYWMKRVIQFCCREAQIFRAHPELHNHPKTELFLELHCGSQRVLLYLMTVRATVAKLHFTGHLMPSHLIMDVYPLYNIIRPDWLSGSCLLKIGDLELELPRMISVPWYKKRVVNQITQGNYEIQVLATEGAFLYRIMASGNEPIPANNPYSGLILELRRREREYLTGPSAPDPLRDLQTVTEN